MFGLSMRDSPVIGVIAASVVCIGGVTAWLVFRRRPDPDEIERERRAELVRSGRIIDGTILDVAEIDPAAAEPRELRFILYKYEIGGVAYECSQDVSALRGHLDPADVRLSYPCSVRYDIHRPVNSIVVAENWTGLRTTSQPVPLSPSKPGRKPRNSVRAL